MAGSIKLIEGFEINSSDVALQQIYSNVAPNFQYVAGRYHGTALKSVANTEGSFRIPSKYIAHAGGPTRYWQVGFALYVSDYDASDSGLTRNIIIPYKDSVAASSQTFSITLSASSYLMRFNGEVLGAAGAYDTWYYMEIRWKSSDSPGILGEYFVYANGALVGSRTGIVSPDLGIEADEVEFVLHPPVGPGPAFDTIITVDDIYIFSSDTNDYPTIEDKVVEGLLPTVDGAINDLLPSTGIDNYEMVNDTEADEDTTYVAGSGSGDEESYEFENLSVINSSILAVQSTIRSRLTASGSQNVTFRYRDAGGTPASGNSFTQQSVSYDTEIEIYETQPVSASAWTIADVNNGEFGFRL